MSLRPDPDKMPSEAYPLVVSAFTGTFQFSGHNVHVLREALDYVAGQVYPDNVVAKSTDANLTCSRDEALAALDGLCKGTFKGAVPWLSIMLLLIEALQKILG